MIKTVLFDLGNVVLPFDISRLARRLSAHSHLTTEQIIERLWNDALADEFETGKMTPEAYFAHVSLICEFKNLTFNDFIPIFNDIFDEDKGIVALITRLKNKYKLGLISNTNPIHSLHVVERYDSLGHFDRLWFSNEAGLRKPNPAIYTMALDHFNIKPSEAVFIDDMEINIASARNVGMHGIHYQGVLTHLEEELRRIGVDH